MGSKSTSKKVGQLGKIMKIASKHAHHQQGLDAPKKQFQQQTQPSVRIEEQNAVQELGFLGGTIPVVVRER